MKLTVIIFKLNSMSSNYMHGIGMAEGRIIKKNSMVHKIAGGGIHGALDMVATTMKKIFTRLIKFSHFRDFATTS